MTTLTVDLQSTIILVALVAGAVRGLIGYYINAPDGESFNLRKVAGTMIRYAILNVIAVNGSSTVGGTEWTSTGIIVITAIWLANDLGIDVYKMLK